MRLLPDTLAGRAILVLLIGLGLFHVGSIWIYQIGLENVLRTTREDDLAERLVSLERTAAGLPLEDRERAAHALSTAALEVHWSPISSIADVPTEAEGIRALRDRLKQLAPEIGEERLRFGYADEGRPSGETVHSGPHVLLGSLQLSDGSWVNVRAGLFEPSVASKHGALGSLTAMALGILIVSVLLVRWMAAPLETLARAADRIGVDPNPIPLSPTGPREVRHAAHAFNAMQQRIRRLIDDRTQTLAASPTT
jgi:methyl-accepting chemotaxis protein